ncbi:MAG: hypothetical protein Q9178_004990 [Gyalolechia marmorata]
MTTSPIDHPPTSSKPAPFRFKRKTSHDSPASDLLPSKRRSHSPSTSNQTAFRESLFDALADDEGAAFWESVYGQPIHTYSPYIRSAGGGSSSSKDDNNKVDDPKQAELQRMTDDEYATYVRARMWEKSHAHIVEERRRREEQKSRRREQEGQRRDWERDVEDALRRGEEKRRKNRWKDAWGRYVRGWEALSSSGHAQGKKIKDQIPWPVETGRYRDVDREQVEIFFRHAPQSEQPGEGFGLGRVLKLERVRWHPDKFLQKAGADGLDGEIVAMVTAVFQIIDRLWSEVRLA